MRLPEVQARLIDLASLHGLPELASLASHIRRRKRAVKAPATSKKMTPGLAVKIRKFKQLHPEMTQLAIANVFGVNQGRVSEALHGKRR